MAEACSGIGSFANIYKFLKVTDKNCNGAIEKGKDEGYENIQKADINGDGQATAAELKYYLNFLRPNNSEEIDELSRLKEQNPMFEEDRIGLAKSLDCFVEKTIASKDRPKNIDLLMITALDLANLGYKDKAEDVLLMAVNMAYEIADIYERILSLGNIAVLMQSIGLDRASILAVFDHIQRTYSRGVFDDQFQLEKTAEAFRMLKYQLQISFDIQVKSWSGIPIVNQCLINNSGPMYQGGIYSFGYQIIGSEEEAIVFLKPDRVSIDGNKVVISYSSPEPKEINFEFQSPESAASFVHEMDRLPTIEQKEEETARIKKYIEQYGNRSVDGCLRALE